jgi:hypothetical protein
MEKLKVKVRRKKLPEASVNELIEELRRRPEVAHALITLHKDMHQMSEETSDKIRHMIDGVIKE